MSNTINKITLLCLLISLALASSCSSERNTTPSDPAETTQTPAEADESNTDSPSLAAAGPLHDSSGTDLSGDILLPPPAPELNIDAEPGKLLFNWQPIALQAEASIEIYNRVTRREQSIVTGLSPSTNTFDLPINTFEFAWDDSEFILSVCDETDCLRSYTTPVDHLRDASVVRLTPPPGMEDDSYGASLGIAANGRVVVIGVPDTDTPANSSHPATPTITDNGEVKAGKASLLFDVNGIWWEGATLVSDSSSPADRFAQSLASDAQGDTIVVGAPGDSRLANQAGAAFVFQRFGESWFQTTELLPGMARESAAFGSQVVISSDAKIIAVSAPGDSNPGNDPFALETSSPASGSVSIYRFDEVIGDWLLSDYLRSSDISNSTQFGATLSMSSDGQILAVAAPAEIVKEEAGNSSSTGTAYLFELLNSGAILRQQITASSMSQAAMQATQTSDTGSENFNGSDNNSLDQTNSGTVQFAATLELSADASALAISCLYHSVQSDELQYQIVNKPKAQVELFRRDTDRTFVYQTNLIPSGQHSNNTELDIALSGQGQHLAVAVRSPEFDLQSSGNTVTLYQQEPANDASELPRWTARNVFTAPEDKLSTDIINFASAIGFSTGADRLFISAKGSNSVFVY